MMNRSERDGKRKSSFQDAITNEEDTKDAPIRLWT